jgi:hypothetical protein
MSYQEHLVEVARVYALAADQNRPPTKAVRTHFKISQSTAGSWVGHARKAGLLPFVAPGHLMGHRNAKAVRVAQALGVEYDDLIAALFEHAAGRIQMK